MSGRDDDARLHQIAPTERAIRIATLNDALRRRGVGGRLVVTAGVIALGDRALPQIMRAVADFDTFNGDNDPHGEHDFGMLYHEGTKLFWKIDCYDLAMRFGSPDPADPAVTTRVLTVLLAEEW